MIENKMTPVLKWAGGKSQLLPQIMEKIPKTFNRYYEPFIGGGAVFFAIEPQMAVISDTNEQLINLYQFLKSDVYSVISIVNELDKVKCDKLFYYSIREKYNNKISEHALDAESAALMIWINKHCFNGLYRVNSKGLFNVPYNNKISGKSIDDNNLINISNYLNTHDVIIQCNDFEEICKKVVCGDFVYFDSPYVPVSQTADFTDYTKDGFLKSDHERLASLFKKLDNLGVKIMLTNNDVPLVHSLYQGYNFQPIDVKRMINCNAKKE